MGAAEAGKDEVEDYFQTFVDVFCNVVGCLVFIILFISLMISQTKVALLVPKYLPRKMAVSIYFECKDDKIYFIDTETIMRVVTKATQTAGQMGDLDSAVQVIGQTDFDTDSYTVDKSQILSAIIQVSLKQDAVNVDLTKLVKAPKAKKGESKSEAEKTEKKENAEGLPVELEHKPAYVRSMYRVQQQNGLVYFIVRPSAVKNFSILRDKLKSEYLVGWELRRNESSPIRLSLQVANN